jgi:predicted PurR-regulated permease PerM
VIFAGLLVAVALAGLADWVVRHTGVRRSVALGLVVLAIAAGIALGIWTLAADVAEQTARTFSARTSRSPASRPRRPEPPDILSGCTSRRP